jgi:hypothetical protein
MINYDTSNITTREDFVRFLRFLYHTYLHEGSTWENAKLKEFLEALTCYTEDIPTYKKNNEIDIHADPDNPSWKVFADILIGATLYE